MVTWHEFKKIFRKKELSKKYYDSKAKQSYELKVGSMMDEEYTTKLLELSRYVPYHKNENDQIERLSMDFNKNLAIELNMMALSHLRKLLRIRNTLTSNQSVRVNFSRDGKEI